MSEQAGGHGQGTPFVARYGLVRPLQGRYLAGVCAALGRATRTDPVLWRVTLAVLVCFGGVGALLYLLLWLITPEEGDTASPVEAMFGQGRSDTSPVLVVVLLVLAAATFIFIAPRPLYILLLATVVLLAVVLLAQHRGTGAVGAPPPPAPTTAPTTAPAAAATPPAASAPPAPGAAPPAGASAVPATGWPSEGAVSAAVPEPVPDPDPDPDPDATVPAAPVPPAPAPPPPPTGGYREPFAPRGPFASQPAPPPSPLAPPRERSPLGTITFFSLLLALGLLGALDLAGVLDVPLAGYVAAGLAVCGAGLVVGAWLGRARVLIALGLVLALALPFAHAADSWERPRHMGTEVTWTPASAADLDERYEVSFGTGTLDLRQVDFTDRDAATHLRVSFGELVVLLPPEVAVEVDTRVRLGGADVLDEQFGGLRTDRHVTGGDPAAGTLRLTASVSMANLEVRQ